MKGGQAMTRKAVVLARGLGTRMRREAEDVQLSQQALRAAERGHKALMPLRGRPFLDYIADSLLRAGLNELAFVVAPDADPMRAAAERISAVSGAHVECVVQQEARGTADAVVAAEDFVAGEPFVVCNGDNLYPDAALCAATSRQDSACWVVAFDREALVREGNIEPERARAFAVVILGSGQRLRGIVEKPEQPEQYKQEGRLWINMNLYRFTPAIFSACRAIEPDPLRQELELTTAVALLLARGEPEFGVLPCEGGVLDLTARADVPAVERALGDRCLSF